MSTLAPAWRDHVRTDPPRPPPGLRLMSSAASEPGPSSGGGEDPVLLILAIAERADRAAFSALFAQFAPRVKSYMLRLGAPAAAAEELAQETLLQVWRKAARFD